MKIAVTGHRPDKLGKEYLLVGPHTDYIREKLLLALDPFMKYQPTLITGMALGVDQLFAKIAIANVLPFIAALPCRNQDKLWPNPSKRLYHELLSKATMIIYVHDGEYTKSCMQERNEFMVDNCDLLIAVFDGSPGGTYNCVEYAVNNNTSILRIDPKLP